MRERDNQENTRKKKQEKYKRKIRGSVSVNKDRTETRIGSTKARW